MNWYLQLELKRDLRCRLAVPSVYVSRFHISGHWDPDALARWNTVMSYLGLVSKAGRPCAEITMEFGTHAGETAVVRRIVRFLL